MKPTERRVGYGTALGYGVTDLFGGGAFALIATWLLFFYTTYCGLSMVEAGSIFLIARFADAIASPIMGYITDRFGNTRLGKRFGRRRFFILIGSPLMFLYAFVWVQDMGYWYYLGTYLSIELLSAMVMVPWETLAAEMTNRFSERTRMQAIRLSCSKIGNVLSASLPGVMIYFFGKDSALTYTYTGIVFATIFFVATLITYFCTWEAQDTDPDFEKNNTGPQLSLGSHLWHLATELASTFKIRAFRLHMLIYICSFTAMDIFRSVFVYFVVYAMLQEASAASGYLTITTAMAVPSTIAFMFILDKLSVTLSGGLRASYLFIMATLLILFVNYAYGLHLSGWVLSGAFILLGFGWAGLNFIPWNIYSFIPDIDEVVTRRRREGAFAGAMVLLRKSTVAVAIMIVGLILEECGFVKGTAVQPESALNAIVALMVAGAGGLLLISFLITYKFNLTRETHKVLLKEVARLKLGGNLEDCPVEAQAVIKDLTGYHYMDVWGNSAKAKGKVVGSRA